MQPLRKPRAQNARHPECVTEAGARRAGRAKPTFPKSGIADLQGNQRSISRATNGEKPLLAINIEGDSATAAGMLVHGFRILPCLYSLVGGFGGFAAFKTLPVRLPHETPVQLLGLWHGLRERLQNVIMIYTDGTSMSDFGPLEL